MEREFYSIPEAAAILGISRIAVFKKVKKGQLAALRFGRNWAVPASALTALTALTAPAAPAAVVLPPSAPGPARPAKKVLPPPPASSDDEMNSMGWD